MAALAVVTIDPLPVTSIFLMTSRLNRITAVTLTPKTRSHSASSNSSKGTKSSIMPALLIKISIFSPAASNARAIVLESRRSPATIFTLNPRAFSSLCNSRRRGCTRSIPTAVPPSSMKRTIVAFPMPEPAPVMIATFPANRVDISTPHRVQVMACRACPNYDFK
ncbi:unannotated protein [freshwater metagenome]|uniref:Unannotated protein n=1 Tax=freshwater metagenome TaxID=449393 RepID=A0A6J7XSR2_9ZZZZ